MDFHVYTNSTHARSHAKQLQTKKRRKRRYNMLYDNKSSSNDDSNDNNNPAGECANGRFVLWKSTCQVITAHIHISLLTRGIVTG